MNKTTKNLILSGLSIFTTFALIIITINPSMVSANSNYSWSDPGIGSSVASPYGYNSNSSTTYGYPYSGYPYDNTNYYSSDNTYPSYPIYYQAPVTPAPAAEEAPTPIVYSNSTNPNPSVAMVVPLSDSQAANLYNTSHTKTSTVTSTGNNNLAANAISSGGDSFLPHGLAQWILFLLMLLVIVILVRKISGAEERYHTTPLKHS